MTKRPILDSMPVVLAAMLIFAHSAIGEQRAAEEGRVAFLKIANSEFDTYIEDTSAQERQWMLDHYARMKGWSPRFDDELSWFAEGWFYKDAYGVKPDWPVFSEHPEWILRDSDGNMLYVPFDCSGGTCPQFAADFGNPAFKTWWIGNAQDVMAMGYQGIWIDDVNMTWRVSDGYENHVTPVDPRTGQAMSLADWRRYMAEFMEDIRAAVPNAELSHNIIWYAGDEDNTDPFIARQIDASDYANLERGVTDLGLTGGNGRYALTTFLEFIDYVHARGAGVILLDEAASLTQRQFALAGWFAISSANDLMSTENDSWATPDNWWPGYELDLGAALAPRYDWLTLIRRDFACGVILMNPPDRADVNVQLARDYHTLEGEVVNSLTLSGDESAILLDGCARFATDADGDGVTNSADNCQDIANPFQRDTDNDNYGNICDADFNNDCVVNGVDLGIMKLRFFGADPDADLNGDGVVNAVDLGLLRARFFATPGPSGVQNVCL